MDTLKVNAALETIDRPKLGRRNTPNAERPALYKTSPCDQLKTQLSHVHLLNDQMASTWVKRAGA